MSRKLSNLVIVAAILLIAGSVIAFLATGMYPYTRFRDKKIEQTNAESDLSDLFADTGDETTAAPRVESVNAIGLLPSGPGLAAISVVTVSVPAVLAVGCALLWDRRRGGIDAVDPVRSEPLSRSG